MAQNKRQQNNKYEGMTASKAKRERAKDELKAAKRRELRTKLIVIAVCAAVIALIGAGYARNWYVEKNKTVASTEYSAMLNEDGTIQGVNVADYVTTFDVDGVKIAKADVEVTDEEVEESIRSALEAHKVLNEDTSLTVEDGSEVSIDYVGTMDGVEFEGGSAQGYSLTIGSGSFIDTFEEQLIGSHPGDQVTVDVTFPDPYDNNPDYAGKAASFAVTVNGIYETPAFDDAFVKENLSDKAQTAEEYRQYLRDTGYESKLTSAVTQYIKDNISADSYPEDYLKHLKALQMTLNEQEFNYMVQMYASYGLNFSYSSVREYYGASSDEEYEKILQEAAEKACLNNMACQDLAAKAGITVSDEDYQAFLTENEIGEEAEAQYGKGYLIQQFILPEKVTDYIAAHASVE